ncbi:MAG: rhodanese-like domain-containing protein [Haloferacaceae archaeon]
MDGEISPEDVRQELEGDDPPCVVDIRAPAAYKQGHIPGSVNVPFGDLSSEIGSIAGADHIVTVCPHGQASVQAARLIGAFEGTSDARVESMAGGLAEWPGELETSGEDDAEATAEAEADAEADAPF